MTQSPGPGCTAHTTPRSRTFETDRTTVAGWLMEYTPRKIKAHRWAEMRPFVIASIAGLDITTTERAKDLVSAVAYLCDYCLDLGYPLEPEVVFTVATIDQFLHERTDWSPRSRATRRSALYLVTENTLGPLALPERGKAIARQSLLPPYSQREIVSFRACADGQNTESRRLGYHGVLALGLGAGLSAPEMAGLRAKDVQFGSKGVSLQVSGRRARTVPLLANWEGSLRAVLDVRGEDAYVIAPRRQRSTKNTISHFLTKLHLCGLDRPNTHRLRTTWVVHHLTAGVPTAALLKAAGLRTPGALNPYLQFVDRIDEGDLGQFLRGRP